MIVYSMALKYTQEMNVITTACAYSERSRKRILLRHTENITQIRFLLCCELQVFIRSYALKTTIESLIDVFFYLNFCDIKYVHWCNLINHRLKLEVKCTFEFIFNSKEKRI